MDQDKGDDLLKERGRVIDHLKRLFAIVCGLAITVACQRAYFCFLNDYWPGIIQFLILIVTVPPFFHGAERSLDLQYLQRLSPAPSPGRVIYDSAMLLITAMFFVVVAQNIPDSGVLSNPVLEEGTQRRFLWSLALFFFFDSVVLSIGLCKRGPGEVYKTAHRRWRLFNVVMAGVCVLAAYRSAGYTFLEPTGTRASGVVLVLLLVLVAAIVRTALDYWVGWPFLFPTGDASRADSARGVA